MVLISVRGPLLGLAAAEDRERGGRAHETQPRAVPGEDGADGGAAQEDARGALKLCREGCVIHATYSPDI